MVQQNNSGPGGKPPINVSVDRASVSRADVTRMSIDGNMRDEETRILNDIKNGIAGNDSLKNRLDNIHKAIQDCCVQGAGGAGGPTVADERRRQHAADSVRDAQEDAAQATGKAADETTDLVKSVNQLHESIRVLISQQGSLSVSTGDAAENVEKAGGAALAGQKAQEAQYKALEKVLFKFGKEGDKMVIRFATIDKTGTGLQGRFDALMESLKEARMAEYVKTLNLAVQALQNFQAELVDVQSQFRKFWDESKGQFDEAANGLATTFSLLTDEFENIVDRMQGINRDTERMVIEAIRGTGEAQAALLMGQSLEQIGAFTRETRDAVQEDLRLQSMFGYKGANEAAISTFKLLTRRGIQDDMARSMTERLARQRMELTANIAQNTGLTLDAVKKLEEEASETVENLIATGAVQGEQAVLAKAVVTNSKVQGTHLEKITLELIKSRGNLALLDEGLRKQLIAFGGLEQANQIMELLQTGSREDANRVVELLQSIGKSQAQQLKDSGVFGGALLKAQGIDEDMMGQQIRELQGVRNAAEKPTDERIDPIRTSIDDLSQNIAKYLPSFTGLGIAVVANTAALVANTVALLRGAKIPGLGGGKGPRTFKKPPKSLKATTSLGASPAKSVARKGAFAGARALGGKALGFLGAGAGVVGAGLAGYEVGTLVNELTANEEGRRFSDWLSDRVSDAIGPDVSDITKSVTLDDINKSREDRGLPPITPKIPTSTPPLPTQVAKPQAIEPKKGMVETQMERMEGVLNRIADAMDLNNDYGRQMASGIGRITAGGGTSLEPGGVSIVAPGSPSR